MHVFNKKIAAGLIVATAMLPLFASAQTTDVQSQIQALLNEIKSLQQQIALLVASSTSTGGGWVTGTTTSHGKSDWQPGGVASTTCITLNRNLGIGSQGDDVKSLQEMLSQNSETGFTGTATGFFGQLTAKAMARFQTMMGVASSTDGTVGPLTRNFFDKRCGKSTATGTNMPMMRGAAVFGTITANNNSSVTIQNKDGTSVVVNITASTTIVVLNGTSTPQTKGSVSDLAVGKSAAADGSQNSDGSIQAIYIAVGTLPTSIQDGLGLLKQVMPMLNGLLGGQGEGHGPSGQNGQDR